MTHGLGETVLHTCSDLFKPGKNFSHLFPPVPTCSHLFTPVHNCSHLFTTVHTSVTTLFAQWQFLVEFSPRRSCYFSILCAILLKLNIFAHLIESYPMVHGLSSCIEIKLSIPLVAHTPVTMYARHAMSFFALSSALILRSYVVSC